MFDRSTIWLIACALGLGACAIDQAPTQPAPQPQAAAPAAPPPASVPPAPPPPDPQVALAEEARALLAQAETDVQRARARRALWQKAWEDLVAARNAVSARQHAAAIRHAKRASELAVLGLEQLAYPAVK
jgi:hypothetical protein